MLCAVTPEKNRFNLLVAYPILETVASKLAHSAIEGAAGQVKLLLFVVALILLVNFGCVPIPTL